MAGGTAKAGNGACAIPLAALAAWSAFNLWDYGSVHLLTGFHAAAHTYPTRVSHFAAALRIRDSAVTWLVGMGALSPFEIMLLRGPAAYASLAGGFAGLVLGVDAGAIPLPWAGGALWWGFMLSGLALVPLLGLPGPALRPIWLAAIFTSLFCITAAPFIAARHILLILPALSLLAAQRREFLAAAKLFGLGMSAVLSIGLGMSDYQHGLFYKAQAARIAALYSGRQVVVAGHLGWQYYAALHGLPELDVAHPPPPGTILAVADVTHQLPPHLALQPIGSITRGSGAPGAFCTSLRAGFYFTCGWQGPWAVSPCAQRIDIFLVR